MSFISKIASEDTNSIIRENCYFNGRFYINGSLRIDGKFEGKSLEAEYLYIGITGKVKTNIFVSSLILEGTVIGNIVARKRVMLLPKACVLGDINAPELIIQNGVIIEGRCLISNDSKHSAKNYIHSNFMNDNLNLQKCFPAKNIKFTKQNTNKNIG